jgi:hypothetical protein
VALLLQGSPNMGPSQVKMALQAGATYVPNGGLMGAGAGSVNFMASRKSASTLLGLLPTGLIGGLLAAPSGAMYWDQGTLANRLYAGKGIRLLSILQAPLAWLNVSLLNIGDLNLVGLGNPLASVVPKWLLYGEVAGWTGGQSIMWGDSIYDPSGQSIMWGDTYMTDGTSIMWGDAVMSSADPK